MVKPLPTMRETQVRSLGWEDLLEKEMVTHSSILAWKSPWMACSLVGYSPWGRKKSAMTEQASQCIYMEFRKMVMITLYVRQQKRHRYKEQTFGLFGEGKGGMI